MNLVLPMIVLLSATIAVPPGCFGNWHDNGEPLKEGVINGNESRPAKDSAPCANSFKIEPSDAAGPRNLTATSLAGGSISISWEPPVGIRPSTYRIFGSEWNVSGSYDFVERGNVSGDHTSANFQDGLLLGHKYAFHVDVGPTDRLQRSNIAVAEACADVSSGSEGKPF